MTLVYRDGELFETDGAGLSRADRGDADAEGLYETLRVDAGAARDVGAHLDRLEAGLRRLGTVIPERRAALEKAVAAVAAAAPRPVARLRLVVRLDDGAGAPVRLITATSYEPPSPAAYRDGVAVVVDREVVVDSRAPLAGVKVLAREPLRRALARAEGRGAFEALVFNRDGRLVEGSRSNVVVLLDGGAFTPPASDGCLEGTVRRRLIEAGAIRERAIHRADLDRARGVLLTSSMMGVLPVRRIDDRPVPVGPEGARLRALLGWR